MKINWRLPTSLVVMALSLVTFATLVQGADQTIVCGEGECSGINGALFSESNVKPGDLISRTLTVDNRDNSDVCNLHLMTKNNTLSGRGDHNLFAERLQTVIRGGETNYYDKTMASLFEDGAISLGTIPAFGARDYVWTVYLDREAGNNYQEAKARFDFELSFACGSPTNIFGASTGGDVESEQILGVENEEMVLGESCTDEKIWWWWPLLAQLLLGIFFIWGRIWKPAPLVLGCRRPRKWRICGLGVPALADCGASDIP